MLTKTTVKYTSAESSHGLNESYEPSEITELGDIVLRPNQRAAIAALLDIEKNRRVVVDKSKVYTTSARLSEPFGSGKTFIVLGLISSCKMQTPGPIIRSGNIIRHNIMNTVIMPNLIVVGVSVFKQWEKAITDNTGLKVFKLINGNDLIDLIGLIKSRQINKYDIVLLKIGKTGLDVGAHIPKSNGEIKTHSMYNYLYHISRANVWSRVIYDDYDVCGIDNSEELIPAMFSILVSATNRNKSVKKNYRDGRYESYTKYDTSFKAVPNMPYIHTTFNVFSETKFLEASSKMPKLTLRRYQIVNNNAKFMGAIDALAKNNNIAEMLNGDAIKSSAKEAGITANSISDIFHRLLDTEYTRLNRAIMLREKISHNSMHVYSAHNQPNNVTVTDFNFEDINQPKIPSRIIYVNSDTINITAAYVSHDKEIQAMEGESLAILARVKENISDNTCQICMLELNDPDLNLDVCIAKCCNTILCSVCLVQAFKFGMTNTKNAKHGKCGCCHARVTLDKDIVYVSGNIDISSFDLNNINNTEMFEADEEVEDDEPNEMTDLEKLSPKLIVLRNLLIGQAQDPEICDSIQEYKCLDKAVMRGNLDIPYPASRVKKTLVFNNHDESITMITRYLVLSGIKYVVLQGGAGEIGNIISRFKSDDCRVMVINSSRHCAGLNLQDVCTDIVFYHKIVNQAIESQVIGRMMRIGREWNGEVHSLHYKNEH